MAISIKKRNTRQPIQANIPFSREFAKEMYEWGKQDMIDYIQADGDELDFILSRFKNIPHCYSICVWHGEMARFIAANFPYSI